MALETVCRWPYAKDLYIVQVNEHPQHVIPPTPTSSNKVLGVGGGGVVCVFFGGFFFFFGGWGGGGYMEPPVWKLSSESFTFL